MMIRNLLRWKLFHIPPTHIALFFDKKSVNNYAILIYLYIVYDIVLQVRHFYNAAYTIDTIAEICIIDLFWKID